MARNYGLDTPRETRRSLRANYDPEAFGRLSERFARFLGTAKFLVYMTVFVISWITWNTLAPADLRWDKYPFIFLTLILSLQASYAAPLILLAQNRQADRDRIALNEDRARGDRNLDTETTEDAAKVIDLIHSAMAFTWRYLIFWSVVSTFYINRICRTCPGTELTTDALFKTIRVTIELMATVKTFLGRCLHIRVLNSEVLLKHCSKCDPKSL